MNLQTILFDIFSFLVVLSALSVILIRHPVKSVLSLVACFVFSAITWMLISVEYLALILIIVYVGAVMVLFLFVVMMLDVDLEAMKASFVKYAFLGLIVGLAVVISLIMIIKSQHFVSLDLPNSALLQDNIKLLGEELFTYNIISFEVAGLLLLVAIVAAISLAYRGPKERKMQNISKQVKVTKEDRLEIIESDNWNNI
tara:strand:- start:12405 stop:13001 length:597 start_codon:yes stop_codon:yes gene_type:complete